ncbi:hypothetical protein M5K25_010782 [Dendrobium thyrsiflorum]|uniref:DUF4283 domain-containing protein n=1 Tax=Dendrobium thyrsiflorum TaxID=117978 RepID=A0ABD0V1J3_DENTH
MDAVPASMAWGEACAPPTAKPKGFFNLDAEGSKTPSRSFKEVVSGNPSSGNDVSPIPQSMFQGFPAVLLSDEEVLKLASPYQFTLVGKFSLRRPNLDAIRLFFGNLKLSGFYSIGRPLQTDHATASKTRPSVARILVEVDITKKHAKEVWVGSKSFGYLQKVEFEKVPDFFSHCKIHGHDVTDCFILHPNKKINSSKIPGLVSDSVPVLGSAPGHDAPLLKEVGIGQSNFDDPNPVINQSGEEMENNIDATNLIGNLKKETVEPLLNSDAQENATKDLSKDPLLYISVDSMLHNAFELISQPPTSADVMLEARVGVNEEFEEGEIGSKSILDNLKDKHPQINVSKQLVQSVGEDLDTICYEEEGFNKVGKKKGKQKKVPLPSTPRFHRAPTSSKSCNG